MLKKDYAFFFYYPLRFCSEILLNNYFYENMHAVIVLVSEKKLEIFL